jgi:uncharacterized protein (TIGR03437 family)
MGARRKFDLDHRLDAYFATLRSSSLKEVLKRAGNWQMYAAVTGSAMAMATSASATNISSVRNMLADPIASVLATRQYIANPDQNPLMHAVRLAMARQSVAELFLNGAHIQMSQQSVAQAPSISAGGVVPNDGTLGVIQPGEWITIYGSNLASDTLEWNGDFPTSLGGTSVQINGKPGYLMYVSPTQINLQAPDDTARGTVSVVVTTAAGSATSSVTLSDFGPSFSLFEAAGAGPYVAGIIVRSDGSGAYGGGTYDILGPTGNSLGFATVAAKPGDNIELFGVGFGPTNPAVPAGKPFQGAAPIDSKYDLYINRIRVQPSFVGISSAGLYQINLAVPGNLGGGDVPIRLIIGGTQTQPTVYFPMQGSSYPTYPSGGYGGYYYPGFGFGFGFGPGLGFGFGTWLGTGGSSWGGSAGGSAVVHTKGQYTPRLQYPPK